VKMRLALAIDVEDVVENSQQIFELSAKIRLIRQELARRERRRQRRQQQKEKTR
jgi:hypothetical protein